MTVEPFRIRRRSTSVMAQFGSSMYYSVPESPPFSGRGASIESLRLRRAAWAGAALLVLGVIIAWSYCISDLQDTPWSVDVCSLSVSAQGLALVNGSGDLVLQIRFVPNVLDTFNNRLKPCKSTSDTGPAGSSSPELSANNTSCVEITTSEFYLQVKQKPPAESVDCYEVLWHVLHNDATPEHCVVWDNALWYGGAEMSKQTWPIKLNGSMDPLAYVPSDVYKHRDRFGGVMERYWLSSRGSYIYVAQEVPLYVGWKPSLLCLQAQFSPPYVNMPAMNASKRSFLHYDLCSSKDVRSAHAHAAKRFSKPKDVPATSIFRYPVWSTWALYKTDVNQAKVLNLAQDIISHGFNGSQIEIDDGWTMAYGDHDFDKNKFPNATHMVTTLHDMGFAVTLWVHPFSNYDSSAFQEGVLKGYFISIPGGQVPALIRWWNGVAATLDVTNPMALSWFEDSLQWLKKKYDIDSFKFDAGEMSYLPSQFATATHLPEPAAFGRAYVQFAGKFASSAEVRLGLRTQGESLFVRMIDRDSIWGYELGLKSIIPTVLTFSLLGYSYILPDMIGGNLYGSTNTSKSQLDRELYIRWLELVAFLPAMQFSIPPWHFDDEVEAIARNYTSLHTHFVAPLVLSLAATRSEDPIVRPMWWLAPFEPEALRSNSQFLLGDSVVVAPVLEPGVRKRDVFLPPGTWCTTTRTCFSGSVLLKDYSVMLNEVAYFQKN